MSWLKSLPSHEHQERMRHLMELHRLTLRWLSDLLPSHMEASYRLARIQVSGHQELLQKLEHQMSTGTLNLDLENLSIESDLSEALNQLENSILTTQIGTLETLMENTPEHDHPALLQKLRDISLLVGKESAQAFWPGAQFDIEDAVETLYASPFSGYPYARCLQVLRLTPQEAILELAPRMESKNQSASQWASTCHSEWIWGHLLQICPGLRVKRPEPNRLWIQSEEYAKLEIQF